MAIKAKKKKVSGVTMVELVIVITIVGILASVASMYIKETIDLWRFISFRNEVVAQARISLSRIGRELRQIKDNYSVYNATSSYISFQDVNNSTISYSFSSPNLLRNSDTLASGVTNFTLTYYDEDNLLISSPALYPVRTDIERINIHLEVSSGTQSKALELEVYPRNI